MSKRHVEKRVLQANRKYFKSFYAEVLTSDKDNKNLLSEFVSKKKDNSLESYIRDEDKAWKDDLEGNSRVYLIKDKEDKVAAFFSIKCGLIVGNNMDECLPDDQMSIVDVLIEYIQQGNNDGLKEMYDAVMALYPEDVDKLFKVAQRKADRKNESIEIQQDQNTIPVANCMSAIEIQHFCKNENFIPIDGIVVPLGFGLFWEIIIPKIINITKKVGCKYIYIFAADKSMNDEKDAKSLISYYKSDYKFRECDEEFKLIKPDYDGHCYGLIQEVNMLARNKEAAWNEFSDI